MANTRAQKTAQNLSTLTTAGDIAYASAAGTPARLGIGTTGQVLNVASGLPAWATASASALTLIKRASTSGAVSTGTTFDSVFTSTYQVYKIVIEYWTSGTRDDDAIFKWRKAAASVTAGYYSAGNEIDISNSGVSLGGSNSGSYTLSLSIGEAASADPGMFEIMVNHKSGNTVYPAMVCSGIAGGSGGIHMNQIAGWSVESNIDGFILSTAANMACSVAVYGLAKS